MATMDKAYNPKLAEDKWYKIWEESGYFKPEIHPGGKPYTIIMPPPNANGSLHVGHAVFVTLEDIMIRYHRMIGDAALWLPGADHAGFETQVVYEKKLEKEGTSRFQIPRDELYQQMLDFTLSNKSLMEDQLRRLGASCDWSREKFTLDPEIIKHVYNTFFAMYEDGLVYRDLRPVNWCTKHQTGLSELEVRYVERVDPLYYIKYGPLVLATVRPETKFGDTAVAVHPNDERYTKYVGKEISIETVLGKATIAVIADEAVDPEFGTGVVKITPAHDPNDFATGKRHNLPIKVVIDEHGRMNELAGPYAGMKVMEARIKVAEDLEQKGLIDHIDMNYTHSVGTCYKCGSTLEPALKPQWYVAMNKKGLKTGKNLSQDALQAVKRKDAKFIPQNYSKIYEHWLTNIKDWNISRQIVWGIRIPAWYCENGARGTLQVAGSENTTSYEPQATSCSPIVTNGEQTDKCSNCGSTNLTQDADVFDTWFSSGQWPFVTLKTTKPGDFEKFYPTQVMETAYEILFFWVARMIMFGLYVTDELPFTDIYLHGLVRDNDRQKMSKSKGNVINPLAVAEEYGADAVRFALVYGNSPGVDTTISEEKIRGMRNFANKIWNIARFVVDMKPDTYQQKMHIVSEEDKWILEELEGTIKEVTLGIDKYRFADAASAIYEFIWHKFADKYIEYSKDKREAKQAILEYVLQQSLLLLHPFMPFISEEIYQKLPDHEASIMIAPWPSTK